MTMLKERAIDMINRMPEEKLYYVVQLLESVEGLSENTVKGVKTPEQRAALSQERGFILQKMKYIERENFCMTQKTKV